jgi:peptidoglycan/xylan/chitin deacetylase (PgdA/CDA1 family)
MRVTDYVKLLFGAIVAALCIAAIANASKSIEIKKAPNLTPTVNPATEDRTATWFTAEAEVQGLKVSHRAFVLRGTPVKEKVVALTFDDAPRPETTEQIMTILQREKVPATFFMIGKQVERFPTVVREIEANGFTMGNHTYSHVNLKKVPFEDVVTEYAATNNAVREIVGHGMQFCRPPGGDNSLGVEQAAATVGLRTVLWTDDPSDYAMPGEKAIMDFTLEHLSDGGIILLHDGVDQTIHCLPELIKEIRARGYTIVPLSALPANKV